MKTGYSDNLNDMLMIISCVGDNMWHCLHQEFWEPTFLLVLIQNCATGTSEVAKKYIFSKIVAYLSFNNLHQTTIYKTFLTFIAEICFKIRRKTTVLYSNFFALIKVCSFEFWCVLAHDSELWSAILSYTVWSTSSFCSMAKVKSPFFSPS